MARRFRGRGRRWYDHKTTPKYEEGFSATSGEEDEDADFLRRKRLYKEAQCSQASRGPKAVWHPYKDSTASQSYAISRSSQRYTLPEVDGQNQGRSCGSHEDPYKASTSIGPEWHEEDTRTDKWNWTNTDEALKAKYKWWFEAEWL